MYKNSSTRHFQFFLLISSKEDIIVVSKHSSILISCLCLWLCHEIQLPKLINIVIGDHNIHLAWLSIKIWVHLQQSGKLFLVWELLILESVLINIRSHLFISWSSKAKIAPISKGWMEGLKGLHILCLIFRVFLQELFHLSLLWGIKEAAKDASSLVHIDKHSWIIEVKGRESDIFVLDRDEVATELLKGVIHIPIVALELFVDINFLTNIHFINFDRGMEVIEDVCGAEGSDSESSNTGEHDFGRVEVGLVGIGGCDFWKDRKWFIENIIFSNFIYFL